MSLTHFFSDFVTVYHLFRYSVFSWEGIREMLGRTSDRGWWGSLLQNQWRGTWLTFHLGESQPFWLTEHALIFLLLLLLLTKFWGFGLYFHWKQHFLHSTFMSVYIHSTTTLWVTLCHKELRQFWWKKNWWSVTTSPMCSVGLRSADCGGHCNVYIHCSASVPSLHNLTGLASSVGSAWGT